MARTARLAPAGPAIPPMFGSSLILRRACLSRPSGDWDDNDLGVFDGERGVGRILPRCFSSTHSARQEDPAGPEAAD